MRCQLCGKEIFVDNNFCEDCQRKREEYLKQNSNFSKPSSNQNDNKIPREESMTPTYNNNVISDDITKSNNTSDNNDGNMNNKSYGL